MFPTRLLAALLACVLFVPAGVAQAVSPGRWTMLVDVGQKQIEGMPLAWSREHLYLLARDGRLWDLPPADAKDFRKISPTFASYSPAEMRANLERELKGQLEITGTGHYLVAHPRGKSEHWAGKFEELYRTCVSYFGMRELKIHEPEFPLVAIVWPRREEFVKFAASEGTKVRPDFLGFYSPTTNRVLLYDQGDGGSGSRAWQQNEATIIHEATHQMAFNIGVHNRFSPTPMWLAEGLGTMFEARGVWNWRSYPGLKEKVNRDRLADFRRWQKNGRNNSTFAGLIGSDRLFQSNPAAAYAEAWAWTLFLTETYPRKFSEFVQRTASRPDFQEYPLAQRMSDFTTVFGDDLKLLESHFVRFMAALE